MRAAERGHLAVVQALLKAGADVDIKDEVRSSAFRLVELCHGIM
jgi:ankyrin repeat protein